MLNERGAEMMAMLPWYYQDSKIMNDIINSQSDEVVAVRATILHILQQFYVDTASADGIVLWEQELGLTPKEGATLALRKAQIKAKLQRPAIMTPLQIQSIINLFVDNRTARVVELPGTYHFRIDIPFGDLIWSAEMRQALEEAKPAHLGYSIRYTLMNGELDDTYLLTDDDLADMSVSATFIFEDTVPLGDSGRHKTLDGSWQLSGPVCLDGTWQLDGSLRLNGIPLDAVQLDNDFDELGPVEVNIANGFDEPITTALQLNGSFALDGEYQLGEAPAPVDLGGGIEIDVVHQLDGSWQLDGGDINILDGSMQLNGDFDLSGGGIRLHTQTYTDSLKGSISYRRPKKNAPYDITHPALYDTVSPPGEGLTTAVSVGGFEDDAAHFVAKLDGSMPLDGSWQMQENYFPLDAGGRIEIIEVHKLDGSWQLGGGFNNSLDGSWQLDGSKQIEGGIQLASISRCSGTL
jgi:hypothetical protein